MLRSAVMSMCVACLLMVALGCSDPECAEGSTKIGKTCVSARKMDAGDGRGQQGTDGDAGYQPTTDAGRNDEGDGRTTANASGSDGSATDAAPPSVIAPPAHADATVVACDNLSCPPGASIACTTTCGTQGAAACPSECSQASAPACVPPGETCNRQDDDCDHIVDPNLVGRLPLGARVWTGSGAAGAGDLNVLPRREGGAWVAYRATSPGPVSFHQINARGGDTGLEVTADRTTDLGNFVAGTDGKWIAVLGAYGTADANGVATGTLRMSVLLYRAADMMFIDEYVLTAPGDVVCGVIFVSDVDVQEDSAGNVQIALSRAIARAAITNNSCPLQTATGTSDLVFVTYSPQSKGWSALPAGVSVGGVGVLGGAPIRIGRAPCGDGWFATYVGNTNRGLRRYSLAAKELANYDSAVADIDAAQDIAASREDCSSEMTTLVVAYASGVSSQTAISHVRRWSVATNSGALSDYDDFKVVDVPLASVGLTSSAGRFFVSGMDLHAGPRLFEVATLTNSTREIPLQSLTAAAPSYTDAQVAQFVSLAGNLSRRLVNFVDIGGAFALSVLDLAVMTGLEAAREPGDTKPPVGVTYPIGCPD